MKSQSVFSKDVQKKLNLITEFECDLCWIEKIYLTEMAENEEFHKAVNVLRQELTSLYFDIGMKELNRMIGKSK